MKLPRKGILIRIIVLGPILGYVGWQALERYLAQQALQDVKVFELTPEQARELYGVELDEDGNIKTRPVGLKVNEPTSDAAAPKTEATPPTAAAEE